MTFNQIKSSILNKQFDPVYVFLGDEDYFIDQLTQLIENQVLSESEKAFNQIVLYGRDIDFKTIIDNARQYPMMAERRVVVVREAQHLKDFDELLSYFEKPSPHTVLALALKGKKADKRKKIWKLLDKSAVLFESKRLYENQITPWIHEYLSIKNVKIESRAAALCVEFLGSDLSKISNALDKLILNHKSDTAISATEVYKQIGIDKDFNIFELQKALGQRDSKKAFQIASYFAANEKNYPVQMVIPSLSSYFTKLAIAQEHMGANEREFARAIKIGSSYFANEYRAAAKNYSKQQIVNAFSLLHKSDLKSKGVGMRVKNDLGIYQELVYGILFN